MIAILLLAILAASPTPAAAKTEVGAGAEVAKVDAYTSREVEYARINLPMPGWTLLSVTHDLMIFSKGKPGMGKLWIRGEHYPVSPANPMAGESFVTSYEVDCPGRRARTLSSTVYSGAKMQGAIVAASDTTGDWSPLRPNGFTSLGAETICTSPAIVANDETKQDAKPDAMAASQSKSSATKK